MNQVCSLHFVKDDYFLPDIPAKSRNLKKTAVPSVNLPGKVSQINVMRQELAQNRLKRAENRKRKLDNESQTLRGDSKKQKIKNETPKKCIINNAVNNESTIVEVDNHNGKINRTENHPISEEKPVQEELLDKFSNYYKDEKDLQIMTGLSSFRLLNMLEKIVKVVVAHAGSKTSKELPKISIKDRIVLTFIKLRHNITYKVLSVMFQMDSEENCKAIFQNMISILSTGLRFAIHWPSKQEITKNTPESFNSLSSVRAIVNFVETNIHKPKNVCCQEMSNPSSGDEYTVKFMTAVSPCGFITYISKAFLGKSTDKAIFLESGFVKMFEKNDGLMFDKEFLIDKTCLNFAVQFIKPLSATEKQPFSGKEDQLNDTLTKARLHIKKLNCRIKAFKILSTKVPSSLVCRIEQIFVTICAIVNLNSSILKDNKVSK
ncbi:uncharacterized protein LOC106647283 [Copidosoma floridanum]|uniref:uncharacterized protein LOC106647283 n=1 Tax=Copidosoma floridanum TaxID=29053 RepID=UPI000C6F7D78|nr:uncharacterized protein LOC106647283 [Copidosoma floridanum]